MTRFNISLQAGVDLVMFAIGHHLGGEIFIPKIPSYHIVDVAKAIAPNLPLVEVGIRPGEKLHEEMITATDALNTIDLGRYYAILPQCRLIIVKRIISTIIMPLLFPVISITVRIKTRNGKRWRACVKI